MVWEPGMVHCMVSAPWMWYFTSLSPLSVLYRNFCEFVLGAAQTTGVAVAELTVVVSAPVIITMNTILIDSS